jgi:uncharacterized glyoxalase superfamily protein PhnB
MRVETHIPQPPLKEHSMTVQPIPEGRARLFPYLVVEDVAGLMDFLKNVFGAEETYRGELPDGRIVHAEVKIGTGEIMMGGSRADVKAFPGMVYIYTEDCDAAYKRALDAGAPSLLEPTDQWHGDRYGGVQDPFGNQWWMATHVEDVSPEEMARREMESLKQKAAAADRSA